MYQPAQFKVTDLTELHSFIDRHSFAALVTQHDGSPFATHLPVLLDRERGEFGTLRAHVARANPQWRDFANGAEALFIFHGPHAYVSPLWYRDQSSVPTWDYAVVHAYGVPALQGEPALLQTVRALTAKFEQEASRDWVDRLPADFVGKMLRGIVGIEMEIVRIEGKYKLSQNRSEGDQVSVIDALKATGDALALEVASMMVECERRTQS